MSDKKSKMGRTQEREQALRGIFQIPFHGEGRDVERCIERFMEGDAEVKSEDSIPGETTGFAEGIIMAVLGNRDTIDGYIRKYLKEDWALDRLPNAEKAILRLSIAEMLYMETPKEIAMNEAIELAKKYGDEDSTKYINGILNNFASDNILKKTQKGDGAE
ncbi:transcription antitermination factor NusB [Eubacterium barkeri]|uniref:Transcription antitermination protein NusB n=1 Tax=Eubacterium barkeri TaxID=1528 RepID=A0A1H3E503_EUBBA|nr:transcription antitermination factor NusB [Eubacterium barkeri]SDX73766.1 NusB antitermination factor [Eubacterium barkeri]